MRLFKEKDVVKAIDEHTDDNGKLDDDITCILEGIPFAVNEDGEIMSYGPEAGAFPFSKGELEKLYELAAERIDEMKENTNTLNPYALVGMEELRAKIDTYIWLMEEKAVFREKDVK